MIFALVADDFTLCLGAPILCNFNEGTTNAAKCMHMRKHICNGKIRKPLRSKETSINRLMLAAQNHSFVL